MINLLGKWLFTEEADTTPRQECFVVESDEGDWLLVDVEWTSEDAEFLRDYVVVPVICQDGEKLAVGQNKGRRKRNTAKSQKYFHGKMISRLFPRKMVQPYRIERPLRYSPPDGDLCDMERLHELNCWLETMSVKVQRPLGMSGHMTVPIAKVKSLVSPGGMKFKSCNQVLEPVKLQSTLSLIDDLNTCRTIVPFEASPGKKLVLDLDNLTQKREFEFVAVIGDWKRQLPLRMTLKKDHVHDLIQVSIRKRHSFNKFAKVELPSIEPPVVCSEPKSISVPLLALEWEEEQTAENCFTQPAMAVISDICEMTSRLGQRVPKVAMYLWTQFVHLLSCSKRYLTSHQNDDCVRGRTEVFREPTRDSYMTLCCKGLSEEDSRIVAEKKTKRKDTKKNLKRANAVVTQKYYHNTNRKRAMDCRRFQRGCGRRGC